MSKWFSKIKLGGSKPANPSTEVTAPRAESPSQRSATTTTVQATDFPAPCAPTDTLDEPRYESEAETVHDADAAAPGAPLDTVGTPPDGETLRVAARDALLRLRAARERIVHDLSALEQERHRVTQERERVVEERTVVVRMRKQLETREHALAEREREVELRVCEATAREVELRLRSAEETEEESAHQRFVVPLAIPPTAVPKSAGSDAAVQFRKLRRDAKRRAIGA
jgi:hypothetical protein